MALTTERKLEIAWALLKSMIGRKGIIPAELGRGISQQAKELGIPDGEFREFAEGLLREIFEDGMAKLRKRKEK